MLRNAILSFLTYIDANRASWIVLYTQATSSQAFAHTVREGRERIIDLVARLLSAGTRNPEPDTDFHMMAVALVGAGEAVADRVSAGDVDVDEAAELLINLFWRGLKGKPSDEARRARPRLTSRRTLEPRRVTGPPFTADRGQVGIALAQVAQRQVPAVVSAVDVEAGAGGQHHRLAELHRVVDRVRQLALDVRQNRCGGEHSVRDGGREPEQLGGDGLAWIGLWSPPTDGVAADLARRDAQHRVGRAAASAASAAAAWVRRTGWCAAGAGTSSPDARRSRCRR